MDQSYADGLLLLAMAPCAPYLPMVVEKSRGDIGYAATLILLTAVGTVLFMPIAVPLVVKGLTSSAWTIAKPLLYFILIPLAVGMAVHMASKPVADRLSTYVKPTTSIATVVLVLVIFTMYGKDFISALGSYTILAQVLFLTITAIASWVLGFGLLANQKSVLVLGLVSRNIGPAAAPLLAVAQTDHRALISVLIGLPLTVLLSFGLAIWFGRRA
jgi:BASS family bile acid:Na+ symporter